MTSRLESELQQQPAMLAGLIAKQAVRACELAPLFHRSDVHYVLIASRGSSSNAARYAQYLLGRASRIPVFFATPSLYTIYQQPPRLEGALVIGISQSGQSPDVTAVVEEARSQGRPTLALTNDPESPLAHAADAVFLLQAGEELAVAATKTYINTLGAIALLFAAATRDEIAMRQLRHAPEQLSRQIERSSKDIVALDHPAMFKGGTVIARGVSYGTAFEIALKMRELSGSLFEAYSAADLMHGPVAAIGRGWPVIAVAPSGPALLSMSTAISDLRGREATLIVIADDEALLRSADIPLPLLPGVPEWISPMIAVVPGQLAALRLAQIRMVDVDNPNGLSKVTLTR